MKAFNRIFSAVTVAIILLFAVVNMILAADKTDGSRQYRVEISRLVHEIETNGSADISECVYVTNIEQYGEKFYSTDSDYVIYEINGELFQKLYHIFLDNLLRNSKGLSVMFSVTLSHMSICGGY